MSIETTETPNPDCPFFRSEELEKQLALIKKQTDNLLVKLKTIYGINQES